MVTQGIKESDFLPGEQAYFLAILNRNNGEVIHKQPLISEIYAMYIEDESVVCTDGKRIFTYPLETWEFERE